MASRISLRVRACMFVTIELLLLINFSEYVRGKRWGKKGILAASELWCSRPGSQALSHPTDPFKIRIYTNFMKLGNVDRRISKLQNGGRVGLAASATIPTSTHFLKVTQNHHHHHLSTCQLSKLV